MATAQTLLERLLVSLAFRERWTKMGEVEFHRTGIGRKFYDKDFPNLIRTIEDLAREVKNLTVEVNGVKQLLGANELRKMQERR